MTLQQLYNIEKVLKSLVHGLFKDYVVSVVDVVSLKINGGYKSD